MSSIYYFELVAGRIVSKKRRASFWSTSSLELVFVKFKKIKI
jgi:hypothetical protein